MPRIMAQDLHIMDASELVKLLHMQEVCQVEQLILVCKNYASMIAIMWHEFCICKVCAKATPP